MKKILSAVLLLVIILPSFAKENSKYSIIRGKVTSEKIPADIALYEVVNGETVLHSKTKVAHDGTFGFCFIPDHSGLYKIGEWRLPARIYVSPGKSINLQISDENGLEILDPADVENRKMTEWATIINQIRKANTLMGNFTYKDIFPVIPGVEKQKDAFVSNLKTKNKVFDQFLKGLASAEFEKELYHFLFMPRTEHPDFKQLPEIYQRISSGDHFASTEVLKYDFGMTLVRMYIQYLTSTTTKEGKKVESDELVLTRVKNDTLKGWYFINNQLLRAKTYDVVYRDKVEKYNKFILTEEQKAKLHAFELTIRKMGDGEPGFEFEGITADGKKVKFSDFRGKVVLVDVWATWCGPCKKEIPALKELEKEMHGKEVVFISYSVDKVKDLDKWKKFIVDEQLGGVQLFAPADFSSPVCTNYKINAIPRFMVFDKKGNIVTIDAPRPSTPDLKTLLEKYL